jgi:hypothetical protein
MGFDLGVCIDSAFKNLKEHFGLLFKVGILLYFIPSLILQLIILFVLPVYFTGFEEQMIGSTDINFTQLIGVLGSLFLIIMVLSIIISLFQMLFSITIIKIFSEKRQGRELEVMQAINVSKSHFGDAIVLSIIMTLALLCLAFLLIIPAIIFMIYWLFSMYALVIENLGPTEAMKRSKSLVEGNWWLVFGTVILIFIASFGVSFTTSLFMTPLSLVPVIGDLFITILNLLITMVLTIITISLYEAIYLSLKNENPQMQGMSQQNTTINTNPKQTTQENDMLVDNQPQQDNKNSFQ